MGTVIGSILGAVMLMLIGRWLKGRDFMGFAASLALVSILLGSLVSEGIQIAANRRALEEGESLAFAQNLASAAMGIGTFIGVFVFGAIFILFSKSIK